MERAFALSGNPLRPENVVVGTRAALDNVRIAASEDEPVLIKMHGTLNDSESWVLGQEDYDRAYVHDSALSRAWQNLDVKPLFTGFEFHDDDDDDVNESLRRLEVINRVGGYAILHIEDIRRNSATLKRSGVAPIAVLNFEQVPDIVDEIYRCSHIHAEERLDINTGLYSGLVGAARIRFPRELGKDDRMDVFRVVGNAVEFHPPKSMLDGNGRRGFGNRGEYFDTLASWAQSADNSKLQTAVRALAQYPDVYLSQLFRRLLAHENPPRGLLKALWESAPEDLRFRIGDTVLDILETGSGATYHARRTLAWFAASIIHAHPAINMAPDLVEFEVHLSATKYLLTRYQVGVLREDNSLREARPIHPYTLRNQGEITRSLGS